VFALIFVVAVGLGPFVGLTRYRFDVEVRASLVLGLVVAVDMLSAWIRRRIS
jgi:ABC-type phosphate/phosphonate transport system permease subunit